MLSWQVPAPEARVRALAEGPALARLAGHPVLPNGAGYWAPLPAAVRLLRARPPAAPRRWHLSQLRVQNACCRLAQCLHCRTQAQLPASAAPLRRLQGCPLPAARQALHVPRQQQAHRLRCQRRCRGLPSVGWELRKRCAAWRMRCRQLRWRGHAGAPSPKLLQLSRAQFSCTATQSRLSMLQNNVWMTCRAAAHGGAHANRMRARHTLQLPRRSKRQDTRHAK